MPEQKNPSPALTHDSVKTAIKQHVQLQYSGFTGWSFVDKSLDAAADAILARLSPLPAAPEGYVVVPREPTREMWEAAGNAINAIGHRFKLKGHHDRYSEGVWRAMLSAIPSPEKGEAHG